MLKDDDTLALPEIGLAISLAEFDQGLTFDDHPIEDDDNEQTPPQPDPFSPPVSDEAPVPRLADAQRTISSFCVFPNANEPPA